MVIPKSTFEIRYPASGTSDECLFATSDIKFMKIKTQLTNNYRMSLLVFRWDCISPVIQTTPPIEWVLPCLPSALYPSSRPCRHLDYVRSRSVDPNGPSLAWPPTFSPADSSASPVLWTERDDIFSWTILQCWLWTLCKELCSPVHLFRNSTVINYGIKDGGKKAKNANDEESVVTVLSDSNRR